MAHLSPHRISTDHTRHPCPVFYRGFGFRVLGPGLRMSAAFIASTRWEARQESGLDSEPLGS